MARPWADRASLVALVLTVLGLGVAGYLTYVHYEGIEPVCSTGIPVLQTGSIPS